MAQTFPRFCPRCGAATPSASTICVKCGLNLTERTPHDTSFQPSAPSPTHIARRRKLGKSGITLLLLLVLVFLGAVGYIGAALLGVHVPGSRSTIQPKITSFPIQTTVPYAGVAVTIIDVQQTQNFLDDPITNATNPSNMVRVRMQASNKTSGMINLSYTNSVSLLTSGKKTLIPTYVRSSSVVAAGATQTNTIDFITPENTLVDKLQLLLGTPNEAQLAIPLNGHADVSLYAPKTTKLTGTTTFQGLDWTLMSATSQLSIDAHQASKGMRYLIVMLSVNNTLSQTAIPGSAYDYIRLKAGSVTAIPKDTTLPVSFMANKDGQTGSVTFLIPQNATALTLTLLPQNQSGFEQATINFQLA
ncbi:MAG: hypothetical protein PVS3B3_02980 [Ktedonobacteraceae bacterium]